jgi:hypothetical protein
MQIKIMLPFASLAFHPKAFKMIDVDMAGLLAYSLFVAFPSKY